MNTSVRWINDYLDPPADAETQADLLTRAGFPVEHAEPVEVSGGSDTRLDVELTSNRGDCLCHLGLAREIAALSGRGLRLPATGPKPTGPEAASIAKVRNREPSRCPLYTARIIRGVKVGPSPDWLKDRLIARGDIPRNNIVDATNFVLFELGQPTHVFDLNELKGPEIVIRMAKDKEPFLPIGEGAAEIKLAGSDLVIADAERAVAIAGVKGGALTAVRDQTTDILIEAATFDPVTVRNTSRRLNIASDSSYRFERGVHAAQVNHAADRLAALILELAGGEWCEGVVSDGAAIPEPREVSMRCPRCRDLLGMEIDDAAITGMLERLGFQPRAEGGTLRCTIPPNRLDIEREVDLVEEVSRMVGHDTIPIADRIEIRVAPPQSKVLARRAVNDALAGWGYLETITHSLISDQAARPFLPGQMQLLRVDDERAGAEPALRPSILPSLLRVMAFNLDNGVRDGKFFETASTFAMSGEQHMETVNLAIIHTAESSERGLREMRGVIDRLVRIIRGTDATTQVEASGVLPWFAPGAAIRTGGDERLLGAFGVIDPKVARQFDIDQPVFAAEIGLPAWYEQYPPVTEARPLPSFPAIERDLSVIIDESVSWLDLELRLRELVIDHLESIEFVTTFRGKPIEKGRKSLTLRLRFRASNRTLTHEEADEQIAPVMRTLESAFGAKIRQ